MASNLKLSNVAVNAEANALAPLANNGYIHIYDGAQPATADTAVSGQVLLAELRFNATAFLTAVSGILTANPITADTSADNSGTASWYRALQSNGTTVLWDGSVGTSDADMILNAVVIAAGANVSISSLVHTVTK